MLRVFISSIIFIIALYTGTGGYLILQNEQLYEHAQTLEKKVVRYGKVCFDNKEVMKAALEQDKIAMVYPYALKIPSFLSFLLTAISFGIIGAYGNIINDTIKHKRQFKDTQNLLLVPVQGGIIGIIILGISYTIPVILTNENVSLKPITVVFLCLFGGIFYLKFYDWIISKINKVLFPD
ncbi:hypothetical protein [Marinigracilibium pacificum]|uniref:Uncharacterized protein n=1 Tax=Marinigracilibium pacificum TaxID=2729599 RepID=A0A848J0G1_9BACT|nr:hypothetical protein [Marinigracilibium pacificum]NMM47759.1 hypothetical protein [Marinigracilibium pacificum]